MAKRFHIPPDINVATPVTADTGTITVTGTVKLVVLDLGAPAA